MLKDETPFKGRTPAEVSSNIENLNLPPTPFEGVDDDAASCIEGLLVSDYRARLRYAEELQQSPFLNGVDWDSISSSPGLLPHLDADRDPETYYTARQSLNRINLPRAASSDDLVSISTTEYDLVSQRLRMANSLTTNLSWRPEMFEILPGPACEQSLLSEQSFTRDLSSRFPSARSQPVEHVAALTPILGPQDVSPSELLFQNQEGPQGKVQQKSVDSGSLDSSQGSSSLWMRMSDMAQPSDLSTISVRNQRRRRLRTQILLVMSISSFFPTAVVFLLVFGSWEIAVAAAILGLFYGIALFLHVYHRQWSAQLFSVVSGCLACGYGRFRLGMDSNGALMCVLMMLILFADEDSHQRMASIVSVMLIYTTYVICSAADPTIGMFPEAQIPPLIPTLVSSGIAALIVVFLLIVVFEDQRNLQKALHEETEGRKEAERKLGELRCRNLKIGNPIGRGAFGTVHLALNAETAEQIAVKKIKLDKSCVGLATECAAEVEALKRLQHPNIVRYLGSSTDATELKIFLEYATGGSLLALLERFGRFDEKISQGILRQVMNGIKYIHSQGFVHGDIKPSNILMDSHGKAMLSDFGNATSLQDNRVYGTPAFMAPEAITGKITQKSDIWSFAVTTVQLMSGELPWPPFKSAKLLLRSICDATTTPALHSVNDMACLRELIGECFLHDATRRPSAEMCLQHEWFTTLPDIEIQSTLELNFPS